MRARHFGVNGVGKKDENKLKNKDKVTIET